MKNIEKIQHLLTLDYIFLVILATLTKNYLTIVPFIFFQMDMLTNLIKTLLICFVILSKAKNLMLLRQKPIIQILGKLRMTNLQCRYQNVILNV